MLEITLHLKQLFSGNKNIYLLKLYTYTLFLIFFSFSTIGFSQTATIKGVILDENQFPISSVNIKADKIGTTTNNNGFYELKIPANKEVTIQFTHISHKVGTTLKSLPFDVFVGPNVFLSSRGFTLDRADVVAAITDKATEPWRNFLLEISTSIFILLIIS